jgi:isoleucyl-tRNA synthetase
MSAFYLDVLKDRLYTSPPQSHGRRSAQTVMHNQLDALARLMAPILPFTAEEIWRYMPQAKNKAASIHMARLPEAEAAWENDTLAKSWENLLKVRGEVTKALEAARADKLIGHPLDAAITLSVEPDWFEALQPFEPDLRSLFITSEASLVQNGDLDNAFESQEIDGLRIRVEPAAGEKCARCWVHEPTVGENAEHPAICSRCQENLAEMS